MDMESKKTQEFVCKDNYTRETLIGILVFGILVSISTIIGVVLGLVLNKITIADSIIILSCFEICGIILIILCLYSIFQSKTTYCTINSQTVKLVGKKQGKDVYIERSIENIQCIVVKLFHKTRSIVFVDNIGKIGHWAASQNGEFIKIQYSRKRLNKIKEILPDCPISFSKNTEFGEI